MPELQEFETTDKETGLSTNYPSDNPKICFSHGRYNKLFSYKLFLNQ